MYSVRKSNDSPGIKAIGKQEFNGEKCDDSQMLENNIKEPQIF